MVLRYGEVRCRSLTVIDLDIPRTFVNNPYAHTPTFRAALRRVLRAYWRRSAHGYTQAQNSIAGFFLLASHLNEEAALWFLAAVSELPEFNYEYYVDGCRGWLQADRLILMDLVRSRCPILDPRVNPNLSDEWLTAFSNLMDGGIVFQWFYKLFVGLVSTEVVLRIWDLMFCGGGTCILHRIVLSIFEKCADDLVRAHDMLEMQQILGAAPDVVDCSALLGPAVSPRNLFINSEWLIARRMELLSVILSYLAVIYLIFSFFIVGLHIRASHQNEVPSSPSPPDPQPLSDIASLPSPNDSMPFPNNAEYPSVNEPQTPSPPKSPPK